MQGGRVLGKKPSSGYMFSEQKNTRNGKDTKLYLGLLDQKLQAARGRDANPINPRLQVKILCSLELEQKE